MFENEPHSSSWISFNSRENHLRLFFVKSLTAWDSPQSSYLSSGNNERNVLSHCSKLLCNRPVKRAKCEKAMQRIIKAKNYPLIWKDFPFSLFFEWNSGKITTQRLFAEQTRFNWTYALRDSISFETAGSEAYALQHRLGGVTRMIF